MSDQSTLQRTLEMIRMLTKPGGVTIETLVDNFMVHKRTIQRTLKTIADAGYVIDSNGGYYRLNRVATKKENRFDIGSLLHFSKEEAWMLNDAIENLPGNNSIKENLVKKLYSIYDSDSIVKNMMRKENSTAVRIIYDAIQNKRQIIIEEYAYITANRGIRMVKVEPISFASDFSRVWAYLPGIGKTLLLRLSGLAGIKATDIPFKYLNKHKEGTIDPFRSYGFESIPIGLKLNIRGYGFLVEDFPMAKKFVKRITDDHYELWTEVCNYSQVTRFCLGLPNDVEVLSPENLKEHIQSELDNNTKVPHKEVMAEYPYIR